MMRPIRDGERTRAAATVAAWLVENGVQVTAEYRTGTDWIPVAIDDEARRIGVLLQPPSGTNSLAEVPTGKSDGLEPPRRGRLHV